jgi:hypothetical protein
VLAHKRIVKPQLVGIDDGLAVFMQGFSGIPMQRVQGHGEVAKAHVVFLKWICKSF